MYKLYAIYDRAAQQLTGPIMNERADAVALRTFRDLVADPKTLVGQHPQDFDLLRLGHIDYDEHNNPQLVADYQLVVTGAQTRQLLDTLTQET